MECGAWWCISLEQTALHLPCCQNKQSPDSQECLGPAPTACHHREPCGGRVWLPLASTCLALSAAPIRWLLGRACLALCSPCCRLACRGLLACCRLLACRFAAAALASLPLLRRCLCRWLLPLHLRLRLPVPRLILCPPLLPNRGPEGRPAVGKGTRPHAVATQVVPTDSRAMLVGKPACSPLATVHLASASRVRLLQYSGSILQVVRRVVPIVQGQVGGAVLCGIAGDLVEPACGSGRPGGRMRFNDSWS